MTQRTRRILRGGISLALAVSTLWAVTRAAAAETPGEAARELLDPARSALALIRFERGDLLPDSPLSLPAAFALRFSPLLLGAHDAVVGAWDVPDASSPTPNHAREAAEQDSDAPGAPEASAPEPAPVSARDNGVPSTTLRPSDPAGYLVCGEVYVHNGSAASLAQSDLGFDFPAKLAEDKPQVLIVHTHGCEAYTMPEGEEYVESDDHRTLDEKYNVVRVGDEIARVLEESGIGVVHDRTLHDYPSYSGAYNRSLETIEKYRAEHPSITYVFDVHRDAVADADGKQYKLLCAERPDAAQLEFVIGSDGGGLSHERWRDNLKLACAVQKTLLEKYPTLMRPIVVRNSRYNQQVSPGSLLIEVGTAGNSLAEALSAARLFAEGFAETVTG
ncbi:MAG: stage II sporulation protein P [Ruminococcaceae bacterium]|nr:stage II sporulation protein P [Oscillospiraceae bacterium]